MKDQEIREARPMEDELLAVAMHELRSPLAAIRNALTILNRCGDDAAMRAWVEGVLDRQVHQMGTLIEELLDFARIRHGKGQLHKQPVDLAQVVALAVETVRSSIDERGHMLDVRLPPASVTLEGDPNRLKQVLTNLLGNAVKYTDPGGRIWLTAAFEKEEIVIRVRDSGIGIALDGLSQVFEPFWQSSRTCGRSQGGLGIGLTLVRQIVAMHGGSVSAASDGPGKGSEFVIRLPRGTNFDNNGTKCAGGSLVKKA